MKYIHVSYATLQEDDALGRPLRSFYEECVDMLPESVSIYRTNCYKSQYAPLSPLGEP